MGGAGVRGASQVAPVIKKKKKENLPANTEDVRDEGSIPASGRSPGEGHSNSLQYSCLENPVDRGAWCAIVHGVAESDTTEVTQHTCMDGGQNSPQLCLGVRPGHNRRQHNPLDQSPRISP